MLRTLAASVVLACLAAAQRPLVVGSKNFTENRLLGEMIAQLVEAHTDVPVERRFDLGGTLVCYAALRAGEIDVYCDYTGTAWAIVLHETEPVRDPLRAYLHVKRRYAEELDLEWLMPFGFANSYALAMREERAAELGIATISDLRDHGDALVAAFSIEFAEREDGWRGLQEAYDLAFAETRTMEHGLAYEALASGLVDVVDAYTTDGKLPRYRLRVLDDDRDFFPPYDAAPVFRAEVLATHPDVRAVVERLAFRIPEDVMQRLNFAVEEEQRPFAAVAREFLTGEGLLEDAEQPASPIVERRGGSLLATLWQRRTLTLSLAWEHLQLTFLAVLLAACIAIPAGIVAVRHAGFARLVLGAAGVVQTIPSLALLAFMIPLLGLGFEAAVAALFLYAVLPIVRNTYTGIAEVDADLIEAARGMGMSEGQILRRVQLPLATRTIMAGLRTATVISVGVATLAAFIGAGGLGEPITQGLYLNDKVLILAGAIPAALLAVVVDAVLGRLERRLAPAHAR